ncbi:hypothetical protein GCM10011404_24890 [Sphingomonas prati]|nr:hypothetical protein GCM10011404_24890 [Sphingomonas prati]
MAYRVPTVRPPLATGLFGAAEARADKVVGPDARLTIPAAAAKARRHGTQVMRPANDRGLPDR